LPIKCNCHWWHCGQVLCGLGTHPISLQKKSQENPAKDKWTEANGSRGPCYKFTPELGKGLHVGSRDWQLWCVVGWQLRLCATSPMYFQCAGAGPVQKWFGRGLERLSTFFNSQSA